MENRIIINDTKVKNKSLKILCHCGVCGKNIYNYPSRIKNGRGKFCSKDCTNKWRRRNRLTKKCKYCGKEFTVEHNKGIGNRGQFCIPSHRSFYLNNLKYGINIVGEFKKEIKWNRDIAYGVGLVSSDGCLDSLKRRRIAFVTKDLDQLNNFINIMCENVIGRKLHYKFRNGCYYYFFTSEPFYTFCLNIGLTPRKSLTLEDLNISRKYFADYLRGEIDGDGSIEKIKSIRKNTSEVYYRLRISIYGSKGNLEWIKENINLYYNIKGSNVTYSNKGKTCYRVTYSHYSSLKLVKIIYEDTKYFLKRKKENATYFIPNL